MGVLMILVGGMVPVVSGSGDGVAAASSLVGSGVNVAVTVAGVGGVDVGGRVAVGGNVGSSVGTTATSMTVGNGSDPVGVRQAANNKTPTR